ncbi:MAG: tetratricopeptide repeat protein, partial [Vicinamibacteria bacterium]
MRKTNLTVGIYLVVLVFGFSRHSLQGSSSHQKTPDSAQVHANRGIALLEQFRFEEAAAEFEAVVALEPDSLPGQVNLGIAYFNQRDFDEAQVAFERAKALDPDNSYVHYNLGLIFKLMGNTEEAVIAFEKVAAQDPTDSMTLYYLGTLYANLGRLEDAEATLRKTLELRPNNESAHFSLGNVLIRQGRTEEGRKELETFRTLKESFPAEAASAGLQYTELGPYAEAIEESSPPLQEARPEVTAESAVRWVEATQEVGLDLPALPSPPAWPDSVAASKFGMDFIESRLLPHLGTGLAFRDLDADGDADLIFVRDGGALVFVNEGGRFRKRATG